MGPVSLSKEGICLWRQTCIERADGKTQGGPCVKTEANRSDVTTAPRTGSIHQELERGKEESPLQVSEGAWPCQNLLLGIKPPEQWANTFLLFDGTQFWVLCCISSRKLIQKPKWKFSFTECPQIAVQEFHSAFYFTCSKLLQGAWKNSVIFSSYLSKLYSYFFHAVTVFFKFMAFASSSGEYAFFFYCFRCFWAIRSCWLLFSRN